MSTSIMRVCGRTLLAAFVVCGAATAALAHHSFAAFDMTQQKTVTGVVTKVDWTNPHIWVYMDVPKEGGGVDSYAFEGMTPNFLARRGWTRTTVQPGMKFTVTFRPMRDGKPGGMFVTGKLESGKVLTMAGGDTPSGGQ
jgi:hypothetical protein